MATQNNADDEDIKTQSGNHAAGIQANDNPSINRQSDGGMDNVEDGIAGTQSGTEGGQSGQGINQRNNEGGPGENRDDEHQGGPGNRQSQAGQQSQQGQRYDSQQSDRYSGGSGSQQGGERAGMGQRGTSQQSDKSGNQQSERWSDSGTPDKSTGNEQSERQSGMQGQGPEAGHDIDDLGNKQSGASGSRSGNPQDASAR